MTEASEKVKVEWIPAKLPRDSEAKVDMYFDSRVCDGKNGRKIGFFRGRELQGIQFTPPEGYTQELIRIQDNNISKEVNIDQFTIWETQPILLDKVPEFFDVAVLSQVLCED